MKKIFNNVFMKNYIVLVISLMLVEIIFRLISGLSLFCFSTLRIFLFVNMFSCLMSYILNFTKPLFRKIFTCILVLVASVYAVAQVGFYNFLGVYASIQTSSQLGAVVEYIKDFVASFRFYYFLPLIPFILTVLYYIFIEKKSKRLVFKKSSLITLAVLVVFGSLFYVGVIDERLQNKYQTISNKVLFKNASNPSVAVEEYGTSGFLFLDIKALFFGSDVEDTVVVSKDEEDPTPSIENENKRVIDDTAWNNLISDTNSSIFNNLNNYFINRNITDKNEYTGLFEGKNVIVLMLESVNDIIINKEYFPNFYKLMSEGWYWENNYSPRNSCATMNNEFSGMTSLYSVVNTCTANTYKNNTYYESIFNLFNNKEYQTFSAHDYTEDYYYRKTIHKNMGSGKYYGVESLNMKYSREYVNWARDDTFLERVLEIIDGLDADTPFMSWLTTVTPHQPYTSSSIEGDLYLDLFKDSGYNTEIKRYLSKLKVTDDALGILLEGLESRGMLDDTVIIMYGDHYPYGMSTSKINQVLDYDTSIDLNAEKVPFVIYNSQIEPTVYSEYTSYINILPTIANLFNLDYDPRVFMGTDLFSDDYVSMTVFADGSWKNEYAYYNNNKNSIKYYTDFRYTDDEIKEINTNITTMMNISSTAIKTNYFEYLGEGLEKKKTELEVGNVCPIERKES